MENTQIWSHLTQNLKEELSPPAYQTFLSSASLDSFKDSILTLNVPNAFSIEWIKEKCEPSIHHSLRSLGYIDTMVQYEITQPLQEKEEQLDIFTQQEQTPSENAAPQPSIFNPKYTFDSFVVGHNNRFAYAASEAVGKAPAKAYNPLFIYGSVGLGKTHLLHAIGNKIQQTNPNLSVKLVSSEKFTNELINSLKDKKVENFRAKYRHVDVLLVDDIQFLAGKEQTQVEFFHTFNELHACNKQIILTSDRSPKEIPALEVRLRTRFEWGLTADIQPPEFETRIAILRKKSEQESLGISDEILHFIATQIPSNVREMEGALNRIVAYASLLNAEVTLSIASNVIRDMVGVKQEKPLSISQIKRNVCNYFQISDAEICSKVRTKEIAYPRQVAMYLARELTNVSLPKIGEQVGNRDHSTVMHACDKIKSLINSDADTRNIVNVLISEIKNAD